MWGRNRCRCRRIVRGDGGGRSGRGGGARLDLDASLRLRIRPTLDRNELVSIGFVRSLGGLRGLARADGWQWLAGSGSRLPELFQRCFAVAVVDLRFALGLTELGFN